MAVQQMTAQPVVKGVVNPFSGGRWIMEPKPQNIWGKPHATWFTCMGVGAALFVNRVLFGLELGRFLGVTIAEWLSLVIIGIGGLILIGDLGKPLRFWKVFKNPGTSWITRGFYADMVFVALAGLLVLAELDFGGGKLLGAAAPGGTSPVVIVFQVLAVIACFIIITYPGMVLAASPSMPLWNTMLIPLQYVAFGFSSALGLAYLFSAVRLGAVPGPQWLPTLAALFGAGLALLLLHLMDASYRHPTGRVAVARLLDGDVRNDFLWGTVGLGVVVPLVLLGVAALMPGGVSLLAALAGAIGLVGNWFSKLAIIRAGTYAPFL